MNEVRVTIREGRSLVLQMAGPRSRTMLVLCRDGRLTVLTDGSPTKVTPALARKLASPMYHLGNDPEDADARHAVMEFAPGCTLSLCALDDAYVAMTVSAPHSLFELDGDPTLVEAILI